MLRNKLTLMLFLSILILPVSISAAADDTPFPGPPHEFYGRVRDVNGNSVPDGTEVKAVVDNETYRTTVKNGEYGFNKPYYPPLETDPSPFYVEDPGFDNEGKTIYFYVAGINTSQTVVFVNGGITRLDLIVDLNQGNNQDSGNGAGENNDDSSSSNENPPPVPTPLPPVADVKGPYRGRVNQTIVFYGSGSYDPDGVIVNYTWNFGDNHTSYEMSPSHAYIKEGVFTVTLTVTDNDNLTNVTSTTAIIIVDSDGDGWSDAEEEQYGTNATDPYDFPSDNDGDYIPDEYDDDDDNDGLTDEEEINLSSNPKDSSDVIKISNDFGVFFFVDTNRDKLPDVYYNKTSNINTTLKPINNSSYLVDVNGDGKWDYVYSYTEGTITPYKESTRTDDMMYYAAIIVAVLFIMGGLLFIYKEKFRGGKK